MNQYSNLHVHIGFYLFRKVISLLNEISGVELYKKIFILQLQTSNILNVYSLDKQARYSLIVTTFIAAAGHWMNIEKRQ